MPRLEGGLHSLKADASAGADDQDCGHGVMLPLGPARLTVMVRCSQPPARWAVPTLLERSGHVASVGSLYPLTSVPQTSSTASFLFRPQNDPRALAHFQVCIRINESRHLRGEQAIVLEAKKLKRIFIGIERDN